MWDKIVGLFGGSVLGGVKDLVEQFHLSPGEKMQLEAAMRDTEAKLEMAIQAAASDVIKTEAQSEDRYVRRARPTFMYMMYGVLGFNFIVIPVVQMVQGITLTPIPLPGELYYLFGAGYLGYVGAREWGKKKGHLLGA